MRTNKRGQDTTPRVADALACTQQLYESDLFFCVSPSTQSPPSCGSASPRRSHLHAPHPQEKQQTTEERSHILRAAVIARDRERNMCRVARVSVVLRAHGL